MEDTAVAKKRGRPSKLATGAAAAPPGSPGDSNIPTIPKKRGRPPKVKGSGRGRPPKSAAAAQNSDNEDLDQDELGEANGDLGMPPLKVKARGRPRKSGPPVQVQENSGNDDDDMDSSTDEKPPVKHQKSPSSASKRRKLGRPQKHKPSEDEDGQFG